MTTDGLILVGHVARAHGIKGQVIVNPETDFPGDRFVAGATVLVGEPPVERTITAARFQHGRPVITLEGITTMNEAEALAGQPLRVGESTLPPLPPGTYYRHDLVGCEVRDEEGRLVGVVAKVEGPLERSRLVVDAPHGEVLVPLTAEICVDVAPAEKRITIAAPEGLLELNAPTKRPERS
jgi:16S rRNA processing protein RimM